MTAGQKIRNEREPKGGGGQDMAEKIRNGEGKSAREGDLEKKREGHTGGVNDKRSGADSIRGG